MQSYDLVIVGAGMVGLTLAAALKDQALKIAIIEANILDLNLSEQPELRVSAINLASENFFKNVGCWDKIIEQRLQAFSSMHVWEKDSSAELDFTAKSAQQKHLGHIVENKVIQLALLELVTQQTNVTLYSNCQCQQILFSDSESWLTLNNGSHLNAKLVVGCDGANSWLRQQANIPLTYYDYGHTALVATIKTELKHDACARQVFSADGPLALLPLWQGNRCSIVWSLPPQKATHLGSCSADEFNKALTIAFDHKLGMCELNIDALGVEVSPRQLFPLRMSYARQFAKNRVALCGDAAHTIHPLAGQGVNLGLQDAAALAETIIENLDKHKDIGLLANLRQYERWRKAQASQMILAMASIKEIFSDHLPAINSTFRAFRAIGMSLIQKNTAIKSLLIKQALGLTGELPRLAKKKIDRK